MLRYFGTLLWLFRPDTSAFKDTVHRSADQMLLHVPKIHSKLRGERVFAAVKRLAFAHQASSFTSVFKSRLQTPFYFLPFDSLWDVDCDFISLFMYAFIVNVYSSYMSPCLFTVWSVFVFYVVFWVLFCFLVSPAVVYFECFLNKVVWYGKI